MSNLSKSQIPNITTAEQLAAYVGFLLARVNPTIKFLEAENLSVRAAQASIGKSAEGRELLIVRIAIPLKSDWETNTTVPMWQSVDVISDTAVPPSYIAG